MSISGNSLSNFSISSSPVTLTGAAAGVGESKSSNEKPEELGTGAAGDVVVGRAGMSPMSSREMSGKAEAALSKSISSLPAIRMSAFSVGKIEQSKAHKLESRPCWTRIDKALSVFANTLHHVADRRFRQLQALGTDVRYMHAPWS